jgi:hypothetical protein
MKVVEYRYTPLLLTTSHTHPPKSQKALCFRDLRWLVASAPGPCLCGLHAARTAIFVSYSSYVPKRRGKLVERGGRDHDRFHEAHSMVFTPPLWSQVCLYVSTPPP